MQFPAKLVLWSQLALVVSLLICTIITPSVLFSSNQGGISNYGTAAATTFFFSAGFLLAAGLLIQASRQLSQATLRLTLRWLATGYLLLVISTYPYKLNVVFENIHIIIAFGVVFMQLGLTARLIALNPFDRFSKICVSVQAVGTILGLLTIFNIARILFTAQIVSGIGFGSLLVHSVRQHYELKNLT